MSPIKASRRAPDGRYLRSMPASETSANTPQSENPVEGLPSVNRPQALVLLDHCFGASELVNELRELGLSIVFFGRSPELQTLCDASFDLSPSTDLRLIERQVDGLNAFDVIGAYTLVEYAKYCEGALNSRLKNLMVPSEVLVKGRDKYEMKKAFLDLGIPSPEYVFIPSSLTNPSPPFAFPFIVKPNLGFSSAGVSLVGSRDEFYQARKAITALNNLVLRHGDQIKGMICESFIDGPEFSVDCITADDHTRIACICARRFVAERNFQDYVYYSPPLDCNVRLNELQELIPGLLSGLGYRSGPSHTELRLHSETGKWYVLETAFRVGFAGLIGQLVREITGTHYNYIAAKAALGRLTRRELDHLDFEATRFGVLFTPATGVGGKIKRVHGRAFLASDNHIKYWTLLRNEGDTVIAYPRGVEYLGAVLGVAESLADLETLTARICSEVVYEYEAGAKIGDKPPFGNAAHTG
jgi:hypothetical protein